ncbi:MAG: hypothetical protein KatS3mg095_0234 [Candidatus Parcubacteria bacterium]|nr:MAG: hypothetical protein KatS3mg095_0234 [Candidatus Parcubacteria bacterium]
MKRKKAFTILESTIVLLLTTIILGITFSLTGLNKLFKKFQENIFLLNQDLKNTLDIAINSGEVNLANTTSTICGAGILISNQNKFYYKIIYATSSDSTIINCFEIASNTPDVFNFSIQNPPFYISKNGGYINNMNNEVFIGDLTFLDDIKLATLTDIDFNTTSIIFTSPYGEPIIYYATSGNSYRLDFNDNLKIVLIKNNERATITIYKSGKISSQ